MAQLGRTERVAAWMARGQRGAGVYRRRRPLPAIAIIVVLGLIAIVLWTTLLRSKGSDQEALSCNAPTKPSGAGAPTAGKPLSRNALDNTEPISPSAVRVTVLNGAEQRGQATLISATLEELGFTQIGDPSNDPLYPESNLDCRGQIRFGPNGANAARTLSLIEPCVQLIRDNRQDASVDLSIGSQFDDLSANQDGRKAIDELKDSGATTPSGGQQAEQSGNSPVSDTLLKGARNVRCG